MSRVEMWKEFVAQGEWGLKEEFSRLSDEQIKGMTPDECILKCYMMMIDTDII